MQEDETIPDVGAIANWFGTNRKLAHKVGELIGQVRFVAIPFAGGMTEIPYLKASSILVNDLNQHVINLARIAKDPVRGPRLMRRLRRTPFHIMQLVESQRFCQNIEDTGEVDSLFLSAPRAKEVDIDEWAYHYFITSWMGRAGEAGTERQFKCGFSFRYDGNGGGSAKRFYSMAAGLPLWRRVFRRCDFRCDDGFKFIEGIPDNEKADRAIYCDPPFPGPGDKYAHKFDESDHLRLRNRLDKLVFTKAVIRYYSVPLIEDLYGDRKKWKIHRFEGRTQTNDKAPEILITN